jgi:hypothetical protein
LYPGSRCSFSSFTLQPSLPCLLIAAFRKAAYIPNHGTYARFAEFRVITVHLKKTDKSSILLYLLGASTFRGLVIPSLEYW